MNWISVKDRLPAEDGFYLVGGGDKRGRVVNILYYDSKSEKFKGHWAEEVFDVSDVTHWMSLPNPPEVEE